MTTEKLIIYIAIMAAVTYLVRMLPFVIFTKKINNRFIKSFLFYVPYSVLAAMTFPTIINSTSGYVSAAIGLVAAIITAYFELGLLPVALISCSTVFVTEWIIGIL